MSVNRLLDIEAEPTNYYVWLEKDNGHTYTFMCEPTIESIETLVATLLDMIDDPELDFEFSDANQCAECIRRLRNGSSHED